MALRVARGLFRLWIVGTALFVLVIALVSYSGIKAEFDRPPNRIFEPTRPITLTNIVSTAANEMAYRTA
jgi:hypothetical protein